MFKYVKELHKLVSYICQLKFEELETGSLKKPNKDWLEIIGEVLTQPKSKAAKEDGAKDESGPTAPPVIETLGDEIQEDSESTISDPFPIHRTAEQEEALKKLRSKIFDLEEPYYELEQLGSVLKSMAHGDDDAEQSGIFVMGRVVQERALMVKDTFIQMLGLLKEIRIGDEASADEKSSPKGSQEITDAKKQKVV